MSDEEIKRKFDKIDKQGCFNYWAMLFFFVVLAWMLGVINHKDEERKVDWDLVDRIQQFQR